MKKPNQDRVSPITKVLVDKIHGNRKVDTKFWQSEFNNPREDYVYDKDDESQIEQYQRADKHSQRSKIPRWLIFMGGIVLCFFFSTAYFLPDILSQISYSKIYGKVREYFPEKQTIETVTTRTPPHQTLDLAESKLNKNREYSFTDVQVQKAMNDVLKKNRGNHSNQVVPSVSTEKPVEISPEAQKLFYDVEFFTGGRMVSQNIKVTGDKVIIENDQGLFVTVSKKDVKTIKRL